MSTTATLRKVNLRKVVRKLWSWRSHIAAVALAPSPPLAVWRLARSLHEHRRPTSQSSTGRQQVVVAAVIERDGKVLLTQRPPGKPFAGYWEFVGGKIDAGEAPEQALRRECREECGIEVEVGDILDVAFDRQDKVDILLLFYRCHLKKGPVRHLQVADHVWSTPAELGRYLLPQGNQAVIDKLVRGAARSRSANEA